MKKIIIMSFIIMTLKGYSTTNQPELLAVATPTYSQVNKMSGGIFGFKSVYTTTDTNGNKITMCSKPGKTKCTAALVVNNNPLTTEECDDIDKYIISLITPDKLTGNTLYNNLFML